MRDLMARLNVFLQSELGLRTVGITALVVLITAAASIGANDQPDLAGPLAGTDDAFVSSEDTEETDEPTENNDPSGGRSDVPDIGDTPSRTAPPLNYDVVDANFGLRTQGITKDTVKVGFSYNQAACGDSGALQAALGAATVGDFEKSIHAFARHINETGGIGGRKYTPEFFDDGGSGCPEKSLAAAVDMADESKVFLAIPGLHVVSDYVISKKVPVWGGRDDPASLQKYGANGLQLLEPIKPTLEAWAAFGKHYLKTHTSQEPPCLIRIETGASGNWDIPEKLLVDAMASHGIKFRDIIVFKDDASTAQQQATLIAIRARDKGCQHVYFMAGNPIGLIFFTSAATQNNWFPHKWTFTSYTALSDTDLAGGLMDPQQWENAVGLTIRVPEGKHPKTDNCKNIYRKYYPNDGQDGSAAVTIACVTVLPTAEAMRRAIERTGVLNANTLLLGADAIRDDFYYDAHVPMSYSFPGKDGPFRTRGFEHWTVVDWSVDEGKYLFPVFPCYYRTFKANNGGCEDLRSKFK
ncbi:MAG: ABC transporter substrate-binding protein [Actinomycetota bacterium]